MTVFVSLRMLWLGIQSCNVWISVVNHFTSAGVDDITRMIESMPRLKTFRFWNVRIFNDHDATQRFVTTLQQQKSRVEEMPWISNNCFPGDKDVCQHQAQFDAQSAVEPFRIAIGAAAATTTTTAVFTQTLAQGNHKVCLLLGPPRRRNLD
jgi:hypothetical protein